VSAVFLAPRRVLVLGSPGSGKSHLARRIRPLLGLPLTHLDDEYWGEGWTRPAEAEWRRQVTELAAGESWILDGNHEPTLSERLARADAALLVDTPPALCCVRILRRVLWARLGRLDGLPTRVRGQAERGGTVQASKDLAELLTVAWHFRRCGRRAVLARAERYGVPVIVISWRPGRSWDPAGSFW
jgi:hypothetical protein